MNDFFGNNNVAEGNTAEVTEERQEENIENNEPQESDFQDENETAELNASSEEQLEPEEENQEESSIQDQLRQKDAEILKIKEDSQNWVRSIQSSFDKQRAEDQKQIMEMQQQLQSFMDSQKPQQEDLFVDEYGDERSLTASDVRKILEQDRKEQTSLREKQLKEQEKVRHEQQLEENNWYMAQPDIREVLSFVEKGLSNEDRKSLSTLDYKAQYYFVKSKMGSEINKKQNFKLINKKQKKLTPTGNPNRNFANRSSTSANALMQALESKRKEIGNPKGFF
jgi:hypothetical protein